MTDSGVILPEELLVLAARVVDENRAAGRTIALADTNFRDGSRVWLESRQGVLAANPNTSAPAVPGQVNFIRNVRYGGSLIRSSTDSVILQNGQPSGSAGSNGSPQGPGIVIRPLGR